MQGEYLGERELYNIYRVIKGFFRDKLLSIILFGSTVYRGYGRDIDLIVIVDEELDLHRRFDIEYKLRIELRRRNILGDVDIHVIDKDSFIENLVPGTFLSGLALGYRILYDRIGVEKYILELLKRLSREKYVLHNKYGSWDLSFYAKRLLERKKSSSGRGSDSSNDA